jgi:cell division transport system permease protein
MSRFVYFTRETWISLRRNLLMTLAGIMTVAVSLTLFGGIWLVQRLVDHGTSRWKNGVELEIFMNVDANEQQIAEVKSELDDLIKNDQVRNYRFLNKSDAYSEFKRIFRDQPALIESTTQDALPTSFRVAPTKAELTAGVAARFGAVPGVDEVLTPQDQIDRIIEVTKYIRWAFTIMAAVLLASSLFLIMNTIRLATYARRREIEVMKLVGASNWFVRIPFMAEGLVQGAIGAGLAFGLVFGLKVVLGRFVEDRGAALWRGFYLVNGDALQIGLIVLFVGAAIGMAGSWIGLRRFLEA